MANKDTDDAPWCTLFMMMCNACWVTGLGCNDQNGMGHDQMMLMRQVLPSEWMQ